MRPILVFLLISAAMLISGCATADQTPIANIAHGQDLYTHGKGEAPACLNCHAIEADTYSLGPHMVGVATRVSAEIGDKQTVEDYLRESILHPNDFLVPGYRNIMYGLYADHLTEQDVDDLIGYILSL